MQEIVASTSEDHSDYEQLVIVTREIQQVADHINEIKRRKDMVEQLISDKKKLDRNVNILFITIYFHININNTFFKLIRLCKYLFYTQCKEYLC